MNEPVNAEQRLRRNRIRLLGIMLAPLAVIAIATLVFYTGIGIPKGTTNKGELLQPPRQIDQLALRDLRDTPWRHATARPGWTLLSIGHGDCDAVCRDRLYLARQIHHAMGRDVERISRIYIDLDKTVSADFQRYLDAEQKDLRVLTADSDSVAALLGRPGGHDPVADGLIFIVDPRGFAMMYYTRANRGRDTIDDLGFLLKYSRI